MTIPQMNYNAAAMVAATGPEGEKMFNRAADRTESGAIKVGMWLVAITTLCIIIRIIVDKIGTWTINKANNSAKEDLERVKCEEKAKLHERECEAEAKLHDANNQSDVRKHREERLIDLDYEKEKARIKLADGFTPDSNDNGSDDSPNDKLWLDDYRKKHPMPQLPSFLKFILGCPEGYEIAVLLNMLSMLGAMCFSRVRAKYLDGVAKAPNLQVIIEGISGGGKSLFKRIYDLYFGRIKESDAEKEKSSKDSDAEKEKNSEQKIISTKGIDTSTAALCELLDDNQGIHLYIQESEIIRVVELQKQRKGIPASYFLPAFDNDDVIRTTKNGETRFKLYLNYTFTGTAEGVERFIKGKVADGTAGRICWGVIPMDMACINQETPELPEDELIENYRDQIDLWRGKYCFTTDEEGNDIAVPEQMIDLSYVNEALSRWLSKQEKKNEPERNAVARRFGEMAFHCAIILHMLWGEPKEGNEDRDKVVKLTLYLADYLIERYLKKFSDELKESIERNRNAESVQTTSSSRSKPVFTDELCAELIMKQKAGSTWPKIARDLYTTEDAVKAQIQRYKKRLNGK